MLTLILLLLIQTSLKVTTQRVVTNEGVRTNTTTNIAKRDDFGSFFRNLNLDPTKFFPDGTSGQSQSQFTYTNSDGQIQNFEVKPETHGKDPGAEHIVKVVTQGPQTYKQDGGETFLGDQAMDKFEEDSLKKHNDYRRRHGVPDLVLDRMLCSYAKEWANHLASIDRMEHRTTKTYGENLYMEWSTDPNHLVKGEVAVDNWYSEIKDYIFGQEPRSLATGHFTQVVWRDSKRVGVAWSRSNTGKILVVANYDPPGNFIGRHSENVPPPRM